MGGWLVFNVLRPFSLPASSSFITSIGSGSSCNAVRTSLTMGSQLQRSPTMPGLPMGRPGIGFFSEPRVPSLEKQV
jgi:hypothetical protein